LIQLLTVNKELIPEYYYTNDFAAKDYETLGSRPTDFGNLIDIANRMLALYII
jgi:hypothetical protein